MAVSSKRSFEDMMVEQGAAYDVAMAAVKEAFPLPTLDTFTSMEMVAHLEKECLSLRRYGPRRRSLQLFSAATRINYVPAYWPPTAFKGFCDVHINQFLAVVSHKAAQCGVILQSVQLDMFAQAMERRSPQPSSDVGDG